MNAGLFIPLRWCQRFLQSAWAPRDRYLDLVTLNLRPEGPLKRQEAEQVEIQIKYEGYIQSKLSKSREKVKAVGTYL